MKIIIIIFAIANTLVNAQTFKGVVKDSLTKTPLSFSNIVLLNGGGTYADEFGKFEIDIKNNIYDTLKISTIGYKPKLLPLFEYRNRNEINLNIELTENVEELDEIILSSKKIKYKDKETLGERRNGNIGMTSLIGYETCLYIDNPRNEKGKIKRAYIELKKRKNANYIATFNLKFYEYNEKNKKPGKALYNKNILVKPKNKKYRLWIDVSELNIKFPKNGVCLGVEMINTIGIVEKYSYFGPMYRYTITENKNSMTWSNYHNTGWKGGSNKHKSFKKFKTGKSNPMFGIEVLYP